MSAKKLTPKENLIQVVKFVAFSLGAGLVQLLTFELLDKVFHLPYYASYLPALVLSVLYNFTVNRRFTFKSATNVPVAMLKVAGYYLVFTPLSVWAGNAVTQAYAAFPAINDIVLIVTMLCNLTTEYLFCRFVVYRKSMNTNKLAQKEKAKTVAGPGDNG